MTGPRPSPRALAAFVLPLATWAAVAADTVAPKGYVGYEGKIHATAAQACAEYIQAGKYTASGGPVWDGFFHQVRCSYKDADGFPGTWETNVECPDQSSPSTMDRCVCGDGLVASGNQCVAADEAGPHEHGGETATAAQTAPQAPGAPHVRESKGAGILANGEHAAHTDKNGAIAKTIRATQGEAEAYKMAIVEHGEIGLQRPGKVTEGGADFVSAAQDPASGEVTIFVTDVKTSTTGRFPRPNTTSIPVTWGREVGAAVAPGRLDLGDPALEKRIQDAYRAGRVVPRQINVDYSPKGQGRITGF